MDGPVPDLKIEDYPLFGYFVSEAKRQLRDIQTDTEEVEMLLLDVNSLGDDFRDIPTNIALFHMIGKALYEDGIVFGYEKGMNSLTLVYEKDIEYIENETIEIDTDEARIILNQATAERNKKLH